MLKCIWYSKAYTAPCMQELQAGEKQMGFVHFLNAFVDLIY